MRGIPRLNSAGPLTPGQWEQVARILESNFRECVIQPAPGYSVKGGPGGQMLLIRGKAGSSSPATFPFQCTLYPQTNLDGSPAGMKVGVEYDSRLYKSAIPLEEFSGITGLNDPDAEFLLDLDGPDDVTGYTSPSGPDDYVFLDITLGANGDISAAAIETNGNGSTIDPTYPAWGGDNPDDSLVTPTKSRVVLATYIDGKLEQNVRTNLAMWHACFNGRATKYPFPI